MEPTKALTGAAISSTTCALRKLWSCRIPLDPMKALQDVSCVGIILLPGDVSCKSLRVLLLPGDVSPEAPRGPKEAPKEATKRTQKKLQSCFQEAPEKHPRRP